jgi:hypothetical protein
MTLRRTALTWSLPLLAALLLVGTAVSSPSAQAQSVLPDVAGAWTAPFEEGGAAVPRCSPAGEGDPEGFVVCKAVAQAAAVLPDGRIVYYNGLEATENASPGPSPLGKLPPASRDSQTRVLDLRSGVPSFTVPAQGRGGQTNDNLESGQRSEDDPFGYLGVPGRPGDGFVGSLAGAAGVPEQQPTSPPDDTAANDGDMFCADVVSLADGRVLVVGGTDWYNEPAVMDRNDGDPADVGVSELEGLPNSNLFDPKTNTWSPGARMKYGRWYPGLVELADGKILVTGGTTKLIKDTQLSQVRRTETYDPAANAWTENYTGPDSENSLPQMPRLVLAPNGKVFYAAVGQMWGPFGQAVDEATYAFQQFFDPRTSQWEISGLAPLGARNGASVVPLVMEPPYERMTLLTFGGTLGPPPGSWIPANPFSTLTTIDATGQVTNELTGNLNHGRWFSSGVALPDGKVLAVAGADKDEVVDPGTEIPVKVPELYDPATGTWTEVAAHTRDRTYHNSALLLPDMRVLLGGHTPLPAHYGGPNQDQGGPFANNDKDPSFEVWSPPYLFKGERPRITRAQAGIDYGERFHIGTPQAGEIESVLLIKTPSPQHIIDSEQRTLELESAPKGDGTVEAVAPPNGVAAPPGWYYLVVNRSTDQGPVPSVARMVRVGLGSDPAEALQPFPDDAPAPVGGSATPAEDTSQAARAQQSLAETAGNAPAPVAAPATAVTQVTGAAYRELSAAPASSRRPASPLSPLPWGAMAVAATAGLTGRRFLGRAARP